MITLHWSVLAALVLLVALASAALVARRAAQARALAARAVARRHLPILTPLTGTAATHPLPPVAVRIIPPLPPMPPGRTPGPREVVRLEWHAGMQNYVYVSPDFDDPEVR